jgi:hypothetical protein
MHPQFLVNYHAIVMTSQALPALIPAFGHSALDSAGTPRNNSLQFWYGLARSLQFWYDDRLAAANRQG